MSVAPIFVVILAHFLTKDDKFLIVTNGNNDNISIIDTEKNAAIKSIAVGRTPHTVRIVE